VKMNTPTELNPFPEPGVYFHMAEDYYHAIPAFSKSLVKKFKISDIDAWEALYGAGAESTLDMNYGSAFHCLVLEGLEAFEARYCKAFDKAEFPDALDTVDDLKGFLDSNGTTFPKSAAKASLIHIAKTVHPEIQIIDALKEAHKIRSAGKTEIGARHYDEIASRAWVRNYSFLPDVQATEVSLFWIDDHFHIPCKARLDAITFRKVGSGITALVGDVKTFTNTREKPIRDAVAYECGMRGYHVDGLFYTRALKSTPRVFHDAPNTKWPEFSDYAFELLFVEKGKSFPNVLPRELVIRELGSLTELGQAALATVQNAANQYRDLHEAHGTKPWNAPHPLDYIRESDIPMVFL